MEYWETVSGFPAYEISRDGVIRSKETGYAKRPSVGKRGYPVVTMRKDGKTYLKTVHTLLAKTFIPNPLGKEYVNHIDGNKTNNALSNLEWCTARENSIHARLMGLQTSDGDKPVAKYTLSGEKVCVYKSIAEAGRQNGIASSNISAVVREIGGHKTAGGYVWKYEKKR